MKRLCGQPIDKIEPTLGFSIETLEYDDKYQLHLWDIGGQSSIRAYWRNYFEKTDGLVWVVDTGDHHRMELVRHELQQLLQQERLAGATLLVLANKQDVPNAMTAAEVTSALQLKEHIQYENRHWAIFGCSAVTAPARNAASADKPSRRASAMVKIDTPMWRSTLVSTQPGAR